MNKKKIYSNWFLVPAMLIFIVFFIVPMVTSLFFSLTVWDFKEYTFVGLDNFKMFFSERSLNIGIKNTLIYAVLTCGLKVVFAFFIAVFLTSAIKSKEPPSFGCIFSKSGKYSCGRNYIQGVDAPDKRSV